MRTTGRLGLRLRLGLGLGGAVLWCVGAASAANGESPSTDNPPPAYQEHCVECHGPDRLGGIGPALIPQVFGRLKPEEMAAVIRDGRSATQMAGFKEVLTAEQIDQLAAWLFTPPESDPSWPRQRIEASHTLFLDPADLPDEPQHGADPLNLTLVVERGDHHVSVLDGDSYAVLDRFPTRHALHGGIKYSPDGRFAYMGARDGWVLQYDLHSLRGVAEIRAGINTRNIAVSADGRFVAVGNLVPATVVVLRAADLSLLQVIDVAGEEGKPSRVSAVYTAPPRHSFIAALKDIPELWEIPYAGGEAGAPAPFTVQRLRLDDYLDDFFFDPSYTLLIGAARNGKEGQVVHLDAGRKIADIPLTGMPHLGSGITFDHQGRRVLATPHLREAKISVIDLEDFSLVKRIETEGPGFFLRSHATTPHIWAGVFFGPNKDKVHIVDKRSLEIVRTLRPVPGATAAHVEFTRDGRHALLSIMEEDGEIIVYDAATLEPVRRLPMRHPIGKYNVGNKISYEEGTSH